MTRSLHFIAFCAGFAIACNSPNGTISVTLGGEDTALTRDPAVTSVTLVAVDRTDASTPLADASLSSASIDLGQVSQSLVASVQLTGTTATGDAVVFSATPFAEIGALDGLDVPLFVQRKGEMARMPGTLADARSAPLLARTARGIYLAGGTLSGSSDTPQLVGYDLLFLQGFDASCLAVGAVSSFAFVQLAQADSANGDRAVVYFVNDATITRVGVESCANDPTPFKLPPGNKFSDFAGGASIVGDDGTAYVVGQTKRDRPSGAVLALETSEAFTVFPASTPRQGAAMTWLPNVGIFLYGGSATAKGAEIITPAGGSVAHDFPSDAAEGLAAIAFDATSTSILVAGNGVPKKLDLTCQQNCPSMPWSSAVPALTSSSLFSVGSALFLLVGDDANGATQVFLLDATKATPIPLRIPRQGARAVQTETGAVLIVGGGSTTIESFVL